MRPLIYCSIFGSPLAAVLALPFSRANAKERKEDLVLPNNCTLVVMDSAERATHMDRLALLRRSGSGMKVSEGGFSFDVDLTVMSWSDLQAWAANEEKCCSHVKIECRIVGPGTRASVRVACSPEEADELIRAFRVKQETRGIARST
ncbi:MAG: hypothetical protein H0X73_14135 [Chthoniobacterales bacterium]|nr:hypothetical protein [Chthoniobacterales bacterium]